MAFNDFYQYRLFELLPILKKLDAAEAEKLLSTSPQVQAQLQKFPNGMQSLDATIRDTPLKKGEEPQISGAAMGMQGKLGPILQWQHTAEMYRTRIAEITSLARDNSRQAIAAATTLPASDGSTAPRAQALLDIARIAMKKNPSAAREALEQMSESLRSVDPYSQLGQVGMRHEYWAEGIEIALRIGEVDLAKNLLKAGMDQAEKVKSKDTDDSDPNRALKAWWPSVSLLSRLILAAAGISPRTALDVIGELPDTDVRVLCQVRLANDRLGVPSGGTAVMVRKKSSQWTQMSAWPASKRYQD